MLRNYEDFIEILLDAGFSMAGSGADGIYSITGGWNDDALSDSPIRWHTGCPDTDPWEWRMRVLEERDDIAYTAKMFFKKSGYITRQWYPYFLAARRGDITFEEAYEEGIASHFAKRVYDVVAAHDTIPSHAIKQLAGFAKDDKSAFDRALTELQMQMFITMCGRRQKISQKGEEYGWSSTVLCTTERFFGESIFEESSKISTNEAIEKITQQVLKLNPQADSKKIRKFILG